MNKRSGFTLTRQRELKDYKGTLYEWRHEGSGAQLIWLSRKEENKTFSVTFKTLPQDDSGIFHILEHCVLGGSEKYAVKEPFAELLKTSVQTFLNAMTFSDKTMYPVASRNEKDFFNLVEVYLDAVFFPSVLKDERIFLQEGWHYAFDGEGHPHYQGVVYNEMKGTSSSLDRLAAMEINRLLFPDTVYRFDSGGDPARIPDLTYSAFKEAHARFYHPSNARFFLDGDLPIDKVLEIIGEEYLSRFEKRDDIPLIQEQKPCPGFTRHTYEIGPDEKEEENCRLTLAAIAASWDEPERQLAAGVLCDVLAGSNEAPLKKAILDRGLAKDFRMYLRAGLAQPYLVMEALHIKEENFGKIKETIRRVAEEEVLKGLDRGDLLASINRRLFRELDPDEPRGIYLAVQTQSSWLYGGDPLLYLSLKDHFQTLLKKMDTSFFEDLLSGLLLDNVNLAELQSFPSKNYGKERDALEQERLEKESSLWTPEERARLEGNAELLKIWQDEPDSPEALSTLPSLRLQDLALEPAYPEPAKRTVDGLPVLSYPSPLSGIVYWKFYFDMSDTGQEELAPLAFMTGVLGRLATRKRSARELEREVKTHIGSLGFGLSPLGLKDHKDTCKLYLTVTVSALEEEVPRALDLVREILTESLFDDPERIRTRLVQTREALRRAVIQSAHAFGVKRARAGFSARDAAREALEGFSYILWIKDFLSDFDRNFKDFTALSKTIPERFFSKNRLTVSMTGGDEKLEEMAARAFPAGGKGEPGLASYKVTTPPREGVVIPSAVSYACLACDPGGAGGVYSGPWLALDQVLSMEYLWNKIRVQGGAYGAGFTVDRSAVSAFYSYRDPSPDKSLETYRQTPAFLLDFSGSDMDLERYIMGKIGDLAPPLSYKGQTDLADSWLLSGYNAQDARKLRRELMESRKTDLIPLAGLLEEALQSSRICVAGPAKALENLPDIHLIDIS